MSFIYFICPETPELAKYCEGFFNYLTYGYRNWSRDRYVSSTPKEKQGRSRMLMKRGTPKTEEMKAGDPVLDRIYQKVITSDCYEHKYERITEEDIEQSKLIVFITSNKHTKSVPVYLSTDKNSIIMWKVSNVKKLSSNKYNLLESYIRKLAKPHQS